MKGVAVVATQDEVQEVATQITIAEYLAAVRIILDKGVEGVLLSGLSKPT